MQCYLGPVSHSTQHSVTMAGGSDFGRKSESCMGFLYREGRSQLYLDFCCALKILWRFAFRILKEACISFSNCFLFARKDRVMSPSRQRKWYHFKSNIHRKRRSFIPDIHTTYTVTGRSMYGSGVHFVLRSIFIVLNFRPPLA